MNRFLPAVLCGLLLCISSISFSEDATALRAEPAEAKLSGWYAQAQLLVSEKSGEDLASQAPDLTHLAEYQSSNEKIVNVDPFGHLQAIANGTAEITVQVNGASTKVPVTVTGIGEKPEIEFSRDILPILSRAGCNAGACHASQFGKGGFVLSVFGFEPAKDRAAIVVDRFQRRVNFIDPEQSLILKKPTMQIAHGGGKRLDKKSSDYKAMLDWIRSGAPVPGKDAPKVVGIEVFPKQRVTAPEQTQQLRVVATYSDESQRDVTHWAKFDSLDEGVVSVDEDGLVSVVGVGQTAVMIRFSGHARNAIFMAPYGKAELAGWKNNNVVDELASAKFQQLGIEPSELCDDATFIRRAFLDAVGSIPTIEETQAFLDDTRPDKREKLIDRLLGLTGDPKLDIYNDRYAALWTLKWSDLLKNSSKGQASDEQRMWAMHNWIKESFRTNKPFDQFVRELITAKGSIYSSGPASYFRINANSSDLTETTSQLFLGLRLGCAKCHHHPFEKYSQADYYSFAAFFSRVGTKNSEEFGLFGRESVVIVKILAKSGIRRQARTSHRELSMAMKSTIRSTAEFHWQTGSLRKKTKSSPGPSRTGTSLICSDADWSNRSTTCGKRTRRRIRNCSTHSRKNSSIPTSTSNS